MRRITWTCLLSFLALSFGLVSCGGSGNKGFTAQEISEVEQTLKGLNPDRYRIILPEINNGAAVGSKTYGTLPVTQVRRVASARNITFGDNGNVQAVFSPDGGGPGSHVESQSPGSDIGRRIQRILQNIDRSQYVLIY